MTTVTNNTELLAALLASKENTDAAIAYLNGQSNPAPTTQANLVLIGDSRLAGIVAGTKTDWGAQLGGRTDILNLAVSGSKTSDWINGKTSSDPNQNVDPIYKTIAKIIASGAKKVIIQLGKNDIDAGLTADQIAHGIQDIVSLLNYWTAQPIYTPNGYVLNGSAATRVHVGVLGPLPVSTSVSNYSYINTINDQCQTAITSGPYNVLNPEIAKWLQGFAGMVSSGALQQQYTVDGVHFNATGITTYAPIISTLESMIA